MAAKRIMRSGINWAAVNEKIKSINVEEFKALKNKNESFLKRIHNYPDSLPKINFSDYRGKLENTEIVDLLEKEYSKIDVKYPKASPELLDELKTIAEKRNSKLAAFELYVKLKLKRQDAFLKAIDQLPEYEEYTPDMMGYYFPEKMMTVDSVKQKPLMFPFQKIDQPDKMT